MLGQVGRGGSGLGETGQGGARQGIFKQPIMAGHGMVWSGSARHGKVFNFLKGLNDAV